MKSRVLRSIVILSGLVASSLHAHPNGTYRLDQRDDLQVTFSFRGKCPENQAGALQGGLRYLQFSSGAEAAPYNFTSGFYVESESSEGEIYVLTDDQCLPDQRNIGIPASHRQFGGYDLERI